MLSNWPRLSAINQGWASFLSHFPALSARSQGWAPFFSHFLDAERWLADMSKNGFLNLFLARVWQFLILHNRETLLGAWRASWRLLGVLGNSPTPPWVFSSIHGGFSPFWGWRGRWVTNWRCWCEGETQLEHGAAAKNLGRGLASSFWFPSLPYLSNL